MQVSGRENILKLITMERVLTRAAGTFYEVFYQLFPKATDLRKKAFDEFRLTTCNMLIVLL